VARDHARVDLSIWDDPDFIALTSEAQRLYLFLLSQRDLSYAGLVPMRLRRWAGRSSSTTSDSVAAALAELDAARMVVVDHDTEEVLVRSLIRRDGIYKQPNVLAAALREAFAISSPVLRRALAEELRRLPVEITGPAPELAAAALLAGLGELPPAVKAELTGRRPRVGRAVQPATAADDAPAEPGERASASPVGIPSSNPSGSPSAKALGEGSGERGEARLPLRDKQVGVPAPARAHPREDVDQDPRCADDARPGALGSVRQQRRAEAERLVRTHSPAQPARVLTRLTSEVIGLLADGVEPAHIAAGLRLWSSKRLAVSMLPELVGEYMRTDLATDTRRARSDADTVAVFERLRATCHQAEDRSPVADAVLGDLGEHVPAAQLAALLTDAAERTLAAVA
jgi:hypothetical protein